MSKAIAYIRASTSNQDVKIQRHEILEYGHREGVEINEFVEVTIVMNQEELDR